MKDAYSFDADEKGAEASYRAMEKAYNRIFSRCGLKFREVQADSGNIGGSFSAEFMVLAESGEDAIVSCSACSYAANMEKAEVRHPVILPEDLEAIEKSEMAKDEPALETVDTPNQKTVDEVTAFLNTDPKNLVKTLILSADNKPVVALLRGDHELNMVKFQRHLKADSLDLANPDVIEQVTKAPVGFAGPMGLEIRIVADFAVFGMKNFVTGGNAQDKHAINVNLGRDFVVKEFADIRDAESEDACPHCEGGKLLISRGIEVGHIFKLGTKYSESMNCNYLDENSQLKPMVMGCYGIGVGRTAAAAIEQNHDKFGIIWPIPIAPFQVILTTIAPKGEVLETADKLYTEFTNAGIDILYDDRDERPGVKFKDADLVGVPIRVTVGAKALKEGKVELKMRTEREFEKIPVGEILDKVTSTIAEAMKNSEES